MDEEIYRKLAEHLDHLPGGFPPSKTGSHIKLLKNLFTPEEAKLAVYLTLDQDEARAVADRAGLPVEETEKRLEIMAQKGLILSLQKEDGSCLYQAVPFIVGIYEFQVNNLNAGLLREWREWLRTMQARPLPMPARQMRTIPIGKSVPIHLEVLPYERTEDLVRAENRFAVAPCVCRRHAKKAGAVCIGLEETCLAFGDFADYYIRTGRGRRIERSDVEEILKKADEFNLVLQTSNSQQAAFICCCGGDCCGVLRAAKFYPRPWEVVSSGFVVSFEADKCEGCHTCLERCQMKVFSADGDKVFLKADRCIGCGLCVSTCPSGALKLERRLDVERSPIPLSMYDTWQALSRL